MRRQRKLTAALVVLECADCHVTYAMPESMDDARRDDHESFYCPHGHANYYDDETDVDRLQGALNTALERIHELERQGKP